MSSSTLDTSTISNLLGVESRILRRYLRSKASSFTPVGTGNKYHFTENDIPTLEVEFKKWQANKQVKTPKVSTPELEVTRQWEDPVPQHRNMTDLEVWMEDPWTSDGGKRIESIMQRHQTDARYRLQVAEEDARQVARLRARMVEAGLTLGPKA